MISLSLSELSQQVEEALQAELETTYWVRAEIASLSQKSGHAYLDLIEKAPQGQLAAKFRATCWANVFGMLQPYFLTETGTELQAGMQILVEVEVEYHAVFGLSLNIINIDPSFTIGNLARKRQQTILRLQQEGVMDLQKSLETPTLPRRIAIISSDQAAGYEDFVHQLQQSGFAIMCTLFPATMQGETAPHSIITALQAIALEADHFDAVVIIRGGGANIDLSCFDDYDLCCHCAQFPLPIITGIGHTRDVSILDMVAHTCLKTPTAVATFLIDRFTFQQERLKQLRLRLRQTAERQILLRRHRIELLRQSLVMQSPERIYQKGYSLMTSNGRIVRSVNDVKSGQTVVTHLQDGHITSSVK